MSLIHAGACATLSLVAALALAPPLGAEAKGPAPGDEVTITLTPAAARAAALRALQEGRLDAARRLAHGVLRQDPDDMAALMVMATAGARTGHERLAITAGQRAYLRAKTPMQRFEASYLTAAAHEIAGHGLRGQLWLRLAAEAAPSDDHRKLAEMRFRQSRAANPLRLRVDLGAGPSDNVNGGSLHDTMWIVGLPFQITAALPGGSWHAGLVADWRLHRDRNSETRLALSYRHRGVWLDDEAKRIDPSARAADLAEDRIQLDLGQQRRLAGIAAPTVLDYGVTLGQTWLGGQALARDHGLRLGVTQLRAGSEDEAGWHWGAGLTLARQDNLRDARRDATRAEAQLTLGRQAGALGAFSLGVAQGAVDSTARDLDHRRTALTLGWAPEWRPLGVETSLSLTADRRIFPLMTGFDGDRGLSARADIKLKPMDFMGFAPTVSVTADRNRSDFTPRDRKEIGLSIGYSSTF